MKIEKKLTIDNGMKEAWNGEFGVATVITHVVHAQNVTKIQHGKRFRTLQKYTARSDAERYKNTAREGIDVHAVGEGDCNGVGAGREGEVVAGGCEEDNGR